MLPDKDLNTVSTGPLSKEEREFLERGGAAVSEDNIVGDYLQLAKPQVAEYENLVVTALTAQEVAVYLNIAIEDVQKLTEDRSICSFECSRGHIYPLWQFYKHSLLPDLGQVLGVINRNAHPLAIQRFFMTRTEDLISDDASGAALSPQEWLLSGRPSDSVIFLAKEL